MIEGKRGLQRDLEVSEEVEAREAAHLLAHWRIEGKRFCDCGKELVWESALSETTRKPAAQRHEPKQPTYYCEIALQDEENFTIGRIGELSAAGAFVHTRKPPALGAVLGLSFRIGTKQIRAHAEVTGLRPEEGFMVRFLDLDPSSAAAIANLTPHEADRPQK